MAQDPEKARGRVIGVGGIFFKSADRDGMQAWYDKNLGIATGADGFTFHWRLHDRPESEQGTVWSIFPRDSGYFDPSPAPFMINYIVDDLDAILQKLSQNGVKIDKREDYDYGRFAWVFDPDGNKIELWEPAAA